MASTICGLKGMAELSGSFALAGFVAASCKPSRTAQAFYVDPALVIFRDLPYPVTKVSGTEVIPGGIKASPSYMKTLPHSTMLRPCLSAQIASSGILALHVSEFQLKTCLKMHGDLSLP